MADMSLEFGTDLLLSPSGDLVMAEGDNLTRQRILRRLLTAVRAYVRHQDYGAGLPQRIGLTAQARAIRALCLAQIRLEASVAKLPIPVIKVNAPPGGFFLIAIFYTNAITGVAASMTFEVPGR